jgi:hypothetical protein
MPFEGAVATPPSHVVGDVRVSILDAILSPSTGMAVWERHLDRRLADAARGALAAECGSLRLAATAQDVAALLPGQLVAAGIGADAAAILASDIADLGCRFARIMEHEWLDVRLERITGNACRKFHADYVTARLITTYEGRATEWLDRESAARLANGACLSDLPIRSVRTGDVALLKGRLWADEAAIVHRPPPIAGTGESRLLLVINPGELAREPLP